MDRALLRKPTTLIAGEHGSRDFGMQPFLADALRLTGKDQPVALYFGAASGDNREFGTALSRILKQDGAHRVLWPRLSGREKQVRQFLDALREADLVFMGGGDVEVGMQVLRDADLIGELHAAAERGVVFAGISAGAIMLGERWIHWPHAHANNDEAHTYECLGIARCSLDTHGEDDEWRETQAFATVRARELGAKARAYGVPGGGALVVSPLVIGGGPTLHARGGVVRVFAAQPNEPAALEEILEPAE
jgi:cyanophycinase-like exopeptidase